MLAVDGSLVLAVWLVRSVLINAEQNQDVSISSGHFVSLAFESSLLNDFFKFQISDVVVVKRELVFYFVEPRPKYLNIGNNFEIDVEVIHQKQRDILDILP